MHRDIAETLATRQIPFPVYYGPENTTRDRFDTAIVFERERGANDLFRAGQGAQRNPRKREIRELAAQVTIYARSSLGGAHIGDHERLCEQLADAVIIALEEWGTASRAGHIPITEAKYLSAADLATEQDAPDARVDVWPGVVYRIKFRVPRGMRVETYTSEAAPGEAEPTGAAVGVTNQTQVRLQGGDPEADPELGCGA
jgi:hypothetical protein